MKFLDAKTSLPLVIKGQQGGAGIQITLLTDEMEVAGDIVQSMAAQAFRLKELESQGSFPGEIEKLK